MKSTSFLVGLLALAPLWACERTQPSPRVAQSPDPAPSRPVGTGGLVIRNGDSARPFFHDFGSVPYGERLRHVYVLENTEGRPLVIQDMLPSCGCTTPRVSYVGADGERVYGSTQRGAEVITLPAGAELEIEVAIDTTLVETPNLDKLSQVRVRSDSATNPYLTLELHLKVIKAFRAAPAKLEFGLVPQSAGKNARTDVSTCVKGDRSRILGIEAVEGTFTAEVQESSVNGETVWIVTASAPPGLPIGPQKGQILLRTTGPDGTGTGPAFHVPILAQISPDVSIAPGVLQLQVADRERGAELHAELRALVPGARFAIRAARLEGEATTGLELEARPLDADEDGRATSFDVVLRAKPGLPAGNFHGLAVFETDSAETPRVTAPFAGAVR